MLFQIAEELNLPYLPAVIQIYDARYRPLQSIYECTHFNSLSFTYKFNKWLDAQKNYLKLRCNWIPKDFIEQAMRQTRLVDTFKNLQYNDDLWKATNTWGNKNESTIHYVLITMKWYGVKYGRVDWLLHNSNAPHYNRLYCKKKQYHSQKPVLCWMKMIYITNIHCIQKFIVNNSTYFC